MMHILKSYLKFLWKSSNEHGVHSPFVFDLVTKCFYDTKIHPEYEALTANRNSLLKNSNTIEVTDFGAGSQVFKSNQRKISAIAKTAGITSKNAELLFRIARYFNPSSILEIGTSLGLGTAALSLGSKNGTVTTLEGCPQTSAVAQNQFEMFGLTNIHLEVSEFKNYLKAIPQASKYDLVYFDGHHTKAATLDYFELLLPTVNNETLWIFDDIHWSADMEEAWEIIKKKREVRVTIDTFQWGMVFFRKEQEKEHFVIRA